MSEVTIDEKNRSTAYKYPVHSGSEGLFTNVIIQSKIIGPMKTSRVVMSLRVKRKTTRKKWVLNSGIRIPFRRLFSCVRIINVDWEPTIGTSLRRVIV